MSETTFTVQDDEKTLVVERLFQAPKSKVWAAWTNPELFVKWWGPRGWSTTVKHQDFTEGGYLLYGMKCEDPEQKEWYGKFSWGKSTYKRITPEDGFSYTDEFTDENGAPAPAMPAMDITLELREENGATRLVSITKFPSAEALKQTVEMGMKEGLTQTWDRLEEMLS